MRFLVYFILSFLYIYAFNLSSPDINITFKKEQIFNKYGCGGDNISPALIWENPPKNTKSFALILFDPDAPKGWWHWIVLNIPASTNALKKDASLKNMPKGAIELKNSYGTLGYGGPCPPKGDKAHRYIFTIYALDIDKIEAHRNFLEEIKKHTIKKAEFFGFYKR